MDEIGFLKREGHRLMDEYVTLDMVREKVAARTNGYKKLAKRMGKKEWQVHFRKMSTSKELLHAILNLKSMIEKRKDKNKDRGSMGIVTAPNLKELQKNIVFERIA